MSRRKLGIVAILLIAMLVLPTMACAEQNCDKNTNVNVDVNTVNKNTNNNVNNNVNNNNVNVNENQQQNQNQNQQQQQEQKQSQSQNNVQVVNVGNPSGFSPSLPQVSQLDVGEAKEFSRLVYPGEVIPFDISSGDVISVKSSSDIAIYTIGSSDDNIRLNDINSVPVYDPIYHRFDFGTIVPIDRINYWTTKATITASNGSHYVVIDNRAPMNGYTHIEVVITNAG